mmetsp:Transcript_55446/g.82152  ORF Transcript_55446/g.82152 Transcript_55446/m.82152 type:complete len:255 (-) Transcript_55446:4-768(-)
MELLAHASLSMRTFCNFFSSSTTRIRRSIAFCCWICRVFSFRSCSSLSLFSLSTCFFFKIVSTSSCCFCSSFKRSSSFSSFCLWSSFSFSSFLFWSSFSFVSRSLVSCSSFSCFAILSISSCSISCAFLRSTLRASVSLLHRFSFISRPDSPLTICSLVGSRSEPEFCWFKQGLPTSSESFRTALSAFITLSSCPSEAQVRGTRTEGAGGITSLSLLDLVFLDCFLDFNGSEDFGLDGSFDFFLGLVVVVVVGS